MSGYETTEQVEARRKQLSRFARLQISQAEKRRERVQLNTETTYIDHYNNWRNEEEQKEYKKKEYEYILPYTKEDQPHDKRTDDDEDTNPLDTSGVADDDLASVKTDVTTSTLQNNDDLLSQLASLRGRRFMRGSRKIETTNSGSVGTRSQVNTDHLTRLGQASRQTSSPTHSPSAPSTCIDFELTSTVMPPTEVNSNDYNSDVRIEDIKKIYFKNYKSNSELPIYSQRRQIIDSINSYSVVIIEGATGCGKTTQVPTYILEEAILERSDSGRAPVIYVTQPRRIAARSIARRVCDEHGWDLPSIVGYQVGLEKEVQPNTILVFCTAGVLLQKIIQEKSLKNYSHIIIDEAHERDADTDLLLMMIKRLMLVEMSIFRLIIMSATMDIRKLKNYFTFKTKSGHQTETMPSYIRVGQASKTARNVQTVYLDSISSPSFNVCDKIPDFCLDQAELFEDCLKASVKIITEVIPRLDNYNERTKSTLVFLPGLAEICKLDGMLKKCEGATDVLDIIPLHSCLTIRDQWRVFDESPRGLRKVILATNIAESSITVTDVGFIIDFCLTKTLMKDTITRFPTLKLLWSSRDKCTQRSGRTGRCCNGKVFRMVPSSFFKKFNEYAEPELLTAPLELSVLRVKNFQMGEIKALFAVVMDPPPFSEIRTAVLELKQIGALAATYNGVLSDIDGDLTELGRVISALPIDVHLSKLIVVAAVFDVLQDAIIVAACLSTNRTVVRYLYGNLLESYEIKLNWARGSQSDLFLSLECFKEFNEYKEDKQKDPAWLASWCRKNCLDERKLHEVSSMVTEITKRLENVNIFANHDRPNQMRDANMDSLMLKVAFCAAFYPNYFLTQDLDVERVKRELCGNFDPSRTVFMSGLPTSQVPIYKSQMTQTLNRDHQEEFEFIADCSKAYLVFHEERDMYSEGLQRMASVLEQGNNNVLQKSKAIPISVYRALKLGETTDIHIREYRDDVAVDRMNFYYQQKEIFAGMVGNRLIPSCMKIVMAGKNADNRCLIEANEKEYIDEYERRPYIEVEQDYDQIEKDQHELERLQKIEDQRNEAISSHEIFKPIYRRVRGPESPIRMSFRSVLYKSSQFCVDVDGQSVNSLLLDPNYEEHRRQMLVAATVSQSKNGRVMARDTTLMPNIRGLPTLMTLLFAQYYRLIYNNQLNCVAGGVFGIGWREEDDQPLDRTYEVDLGFDVHITSDDIALINKARRMMSRLLRFTEIQNAGKPQASLQEDLRKVILVLMRRRRYPLIGLTNTNLAHPDQKLDIFTKESHNMPTDRLRDDEMRPFLPLMKCTRDFSEQDLFARLQSNLDHLHRIERDEEAVPLGGIKCLLCGNGYKSHHILGLHVEQHLRSDGHQKKLREFDAFVSSSRLQQEDILRQENMQ